MLVDCQLSTGLHNDKNNKINDDWERKKRYFHVHIDLKIAARSRRAYWALICELLERCEVLTLQIIYWLMTKGVKKAIFEIKYEIII